MDLYIIELLKEKNRIIIPGLGVFIKSKNDPNEIIFNEFLKYNDGVLESFVQQKENISSKEALEKIKEYAQKLLKIITSGQTYKIGKLGEIYKSDNGKISFRTSSGKAEKPKASPVSETKTTTASPTKETKKVIPKPESTKTTSAPTKFTTTTSPAKPIEQAKSQRIKPVPPPTEHIGQESTKKKQTFTTVVVILLLLIIGGTVGIFLLKKKTAPPVIIVEDKDTTTQVEKPQPTTPDQQIKYHLVAGCFKYESNAKRLHKKLKGQGYPSEKFYYKDNLHMVTYGSFDTRETAIEEYNKLNAKNIITWLYQTSKDHIIGGAFIHKSNADNFLATIQTKGYNNSHQVGKVGRFHFVCYQTFKDIEEAKLALKTQYSDRGIDAWIYRN